MLTKLPPKLLTKLRLRLDYIGGYIFGATQGASIARWAGALRAGRHADNLVRRIGPT